MIRSLQDLIVHHNRTIKALNQSNNSKNLLLKKGDIVTAKVLDSNRMGRAKLLVQGKQLSAQTSIHLPKGQLAQFRVEQTQPHYIFKVFDAPGLSRSVIQLMGSGTPVSPFQLFHQLFEGMEKNPNIEHRKSMLQLFQLLSQMAIKPGDSITPYYLMAFLQRSGLLWENKLKQWLGSSQKEINQERLKKIKQQDFKGLSLDIFQQIQNDTSETKLGLEQVIEQIEHWQLVNQKALAENGKLYLMFPLLFGNVIHTGELLIDISDARKGNKHYSEAMLKTVLLLKMTHIGPIKIESLLFQRQLKIDFFICSNETIQLFKQYVSSLSSALNTHGINIQMIAYHLINENNFEKMSLIKDVLQPNQQLNTFA
jgi:hypothetical protein